MPLCWVGVGGGGSSGGSGGSRGSGSLLLKQAKNPLRKKLHLGGFHPEMDKAEEWLQDPRAGTL